MNRSDKLFTVISMSIFVVIAGVVATAIFLASSAQAGPVLPGGGGPPQTTVPLNVTGLDPTISGRAQVGQTLTADEGPVSPSDASLTYQWEANGQEIAGATSSSYKLKAAQAGKRITVTITASKPPSAPETVTSHPTALVREKVDSPELKLAQSTVNSGATVDVVGKGLVPGATYTVRIGPTSVGSFTADEYGEIDATVTVPSNTKPGIQFVTLTAPNGKTSSTTLVVK